MGRHAVRSGATFSPGRVGLLSFLIAAVLATAIGMLSLLSGDREIVVSENFTQTYSYNHAQVHGEVMLVDGSACNSPDTGRAFASSPTIPPDQMTVDCQRAIVAITSGSNEGMHTQLVSYGQAGEPVFEVGQHFLLTETTDENGEHIYTFSDYSRGTALVVWAVILILAMIAFAAWRGVRALAGLIITLGIVGFILLPSIARGISPMWLALICGAAILIIVVPLVHGINWKSASALAGTLISLVLAAIFSSLAINTTNLRGLGDDNHLKILLYLPEVSIPGLLLCAFIIGALGVLNDVTVSQASTITELVELDGTASPWRLFFGAMGVGRDHIASMIYTLVLSYTGAALPLLLLLSVADRPLIQTLTSDVMAGEILRSGVGALALTLAVPITTIIAAWTVPDAPATKKQDPGLYIPA